MAKETESDGCVGIYCLECFEIVIRTLTDCLLVLGYSTGHA